MANYANLLATIAANIYTNGNNEVTAAMVKTAVDSMVASLGAGYQFMGVATPATTPSGYSDLNCFWLAFDPGVYVDFNNTMLEYGELGVFIYDGTWSYLVTKIDNVKGQAVNLYNKNGAGHVNNYYVGINGSLQWESGSIVSPLIPVTPGSTYAFCHVGGSSYGLYFFRFVASDGTTAVQPLDPATGNAIAYTSTAPDKVFLAPATAQYAQFSVKMNGVSDNRDYLQFMEADYIPSVYYDFDEMYVGYGSLTPDLAKAVNNIPQKCFAGKKWAVIGDSLTEHNTAATKNYHDYVAEKTGIGVVNLGVSGTGYAKSSLSAFYLRISSIPSDVDVITIFGSGNDLGYLPLGDISDSGTSSLCGCINHTIDGILAAFPLTPFGIITPTPWMNDWTPDTAPNTMSDYVDALASICKKRGIPCLDLFYCSNLHPNVPAIRAVEYKRDGTYVASTSTTPNAIQVTASLLAYVQANGVPGAQVGDWVLGTLNGVHPDEDGHKLIAAHFEEFVKSLLLN